MDSHEDEHESAAAAPGEAPTKDSIEAGLRGEEPRERSSEEEPRDRGTGQPGLGDAGSSGPVG